MFSFSVLCLVVHKKKVCSFRGYFTSSRSCFFFFFVSNLLIFRVGHMFCILCVIELFFSRFSMSFVFFFFEKKKTCLKFTKMFFFFAENLDKKRTNIKLKPFFVLYACTCMCVCVVWVSFGAHTSTKKNAIFSCTSFATYKQYLHFLLQPFS